MLGYTVTIVGGVGFDAPPGYKGLDTTDILGHVSTGRRAPMIRQSRGCP